MKLIFLISVLLLSPLHLDAKEPHAEQGVPIERIAQVEEVKVKIPEPVKEVQPKEKPKPVAPTPVAAPVQPTGSCHDWIKQAGITDVANAYALIMAESTCNPNAVNPSSGACGIGQQLPCGKWAHQWNDPVGGMIDMQGYVFATYGSWANAYATFLSRSPHWY
jgi:hypothetical protein